jgi:hypothetical protein
MIKRSLLWGVALFFLYQVFLLIPAAPTRFTVQSLWQDNLVRTQEYLLLDRAPDLVIVGSSLSRGFEPAWFGDRCYNLAATGGNVLSGLEVIRRADHSPKRVLVETNMIMQDEIEGLLENAYRPVIGPLRAHLLPLRERYQPANFGGWLLGDQLLRTALQAAHVPVFLERQIHAVRDPARFPQFLTVQQEARRRMHEPRKLQNKIDRLKSVLNDLKARGVQCMLVEMPFDSSLAELPETKQVSQSLTENFPADRYMWIRPDKAHDYETTDGVHLTENELSAFAAQIKSSLAASATEKRS